MTRDLQLDEAVGFQERQWQVQRIGWGVLLLLVLAGLLGLFGEGPLSHMKKRSVDGSLTVDLERITRHGAPSSMKLIVPAEAVVEGEARVAISNAFLDRVLIEHITPEPDGVAGDADRTVFAFAAAEDGSPVVVHFDIRHSSNWWVDLRIGVVDFATIRTRQFVLP